MKELNVATKRGTVLNGVLFPANRADTVVIAITGIHGNFYSNPFYYNIGDTLNAAGIDFIYAQTNDAFGKIRTYNVKTGQEQIIGSWNENFLDTDEDIEAYLDAHVEPVGDFSEAEKITHTGALVIGTYDSFTKGDPSRFLRNLNNHMPTARDNTLVFIEKTGHTYQQKEQELADALQKLVLKWRG